MTGIAMPPHELPAALLGATEVQARRYVREGREEFQFRWSDEPAVLPVRWRGSVRLVRWGSKRRTGTRLPYGGWVSEDQLSAGVFASASPEPVVIPPGFAHVAGLWLVIEQGVRGVVVRDRDGPVVYVLTRPSTNYYRNLAHQAPVAPGLVGQVI